MDQYEIRVDQLNKMKFSIYLRCILYVSILGLIGIGFYYISFSFDIVKELESRLMFTLSYHAILLLCLIIFIVIFLIIQNKIYKRYYLNYLYMECRLEEIFLLEQKLTNNKELNTFISKIFNFKKFKQRNCFSDASSKWSLDISNIIYKRKGFVGKGVLLEVHYQQEKNGFIQFSHENNCAFNVFDNKEVVQYGLTAGSYLKSFRIFSTYKSNTYHFEQSEIAKKIILLEKFFNTKINIIYVNDSLYILLENYSLKLEDNLFERVNNARFSDKIDALKNLHKFSFDVIGIFDEEF